MMKKNVVYTRNFTGRLITGRRFLLLLGDFVFGDRTIGRRGVLEFRGSGLDHDES